MMDNLVVVGSNSFSGSSFIRYALEKGAHVIGISRSSEPQQAFLPYRWGRHDNFEFKQLDLNKDLAKIINLLLDSEPSYVVNFAAQSMVAESWSNPGDWFMTNVVSTIKFHDELRKLKFLRRYVHITTPEVYGSCSGFVNEDFPFNPSTPYAVSRAAADMSLKTFWEVYQFPVVSTRAANVYGPGQQLYRIIPRAILYILLGKKIQLHGGGSSTRSFIHIRDVAEGTWKVMKNGRLGNVYHISTKATISICDLVQEICRIMGVSYEDQVEFVGERKGKDSAYHLNSDKIREELSWSDQIDLGDGLKDCISWVKNNLDSLRDTVHDYRHKP